MRNRINAEEREHAICAYYLHQYCGNYESVTNCAKSGHPLWPYRLEKFGKGALCAGTDDERSIDHE